MRRLGLLDKLNILADTANPSDMDSSKPPHLNGGAASTPCGMAPAGISVTNPVSAEKPVKKTEIPGIMQLVGRGGQTFKLMRVMQTNACSLKCRYCATRCGRKLRRAIFQPEELASTFHTAYKHGWAGGLFLTSGIPGSPVSMMDKMLATMEILRKRYHFSGYIHAKILPGAEPDQIVRAAKLATRISLNCEAPTDAALSEIAPEKSLSKTILPSLEKAGESLENRAAGGKKAGADGGHHPVHGRPGEGEGQRNSDAGFPP